MVVSYEPVTPTKEQQDALRLVLLHYDDRVLAPATGCMEEINAFVDQIIDKYGVTDFEATRPGERHRAVSYARGNASAATLRRNYGLFRYGLRVWLRARRLRGRPVPVSPLLEPAMLLLGLNEEHSFIDRAFVESCYRRWRQPEDVAQRITEEHQGFWLVYRLSTPRTPTRNSGRDDKDMLVNVSLLRIPSHQHLKAIDRLSPRFIYEFRGDAGSGQQPYRAEGYLVPVGLRLYLVGRQLSVPLLAALNWQLPQIDLRRQPYHPADLDGIAYATNSAGEQIAFYFIAKFIRESANYATRDAFIAARDIFTRLVGAYPYAKLNSRVNEAHKRACKAVSDAYQKAGIVSQIPAEEPPGLAEEEFKKLVERSRVDVVFKTQ